MLLELAKFDLALSLESGRSRGADFYEGDDGIWPVGKGPIEIVAEAQHLAASLDPYATRLGSPAGPNVEAAGELAGGLARELAGPMGLDNEIVAAIGHRPQFNAGEVVDDFEIIRRAGGGSFAEVYLARQRSIGRIVALKVSAGADRETAALAKLDHPHIVRVHDRKTLANPPVTLLYMQFHGGGTLADVVQSRRALREPDRPGGQVLLDAVDANLIDSAQAVPERSDARSWLAGAGWATVAAWTGIRLCQALTHAHARGILHRDIKPANVLLTGEGIAKLADFNVAETGGDDPVGGTPAYMAPEHLQRFAAGGQVPGQQEGAFDGRSDLYSLSILLWELWTGHRPWDPAEPAAGTVGASPGRSTLGAELTRQWSLRQTPPAVASPSQTGAADDALMTTLRIGLANDPADRFINAAAMEARLRLVLDPDAASMFDPPADSPRARLLRMPIACVAAGVLVVPPLVLCVANYQYNQLEVMTSAAQRRHLDDASWAVNLAILPTAVLIAIWYSRAIAASIQAVTRGTLAESGDIDATLDLGHRAALIGSAMWAFSGFLFPIILAIEAEGFTATQALHFMASAVGCGSIAAIYPYFVMTALAGGVYYPRYLMATLSDGDFGRRRRRVERRGVLYLVAAATLPMIVAAGLTAGGAHRIAVLVVLMIGTLGFPVVTACHLWTLANWQRLDRWMSA